MANITLAFLFLAVTWQATCAQSTCNTIKVDGTQHQHTRSGLYINNGNFCNGKPVFQQINDAEYMYYINDGWSGWMVGPLACVNAGGIAVAGSTSHPADAFLWREYGGDYVVFGSGDWTYTSITVACDDGIYAGCPTVELRGTTYNQEHEGTYRVLSAGQICSGKFSYQHKTNPSAYLYYHTGNWAVGDTHCVGVAYMSVLDGAFYPYEVTAVWEESTTGGSVNAFLADVTCGAGEALLGSVILVLLRLCVSWSVTTALSG